MSQAGCSLKWEGAWEKLQGRNSKEWVEANRQREELACRSKDLEGTKEKGGFPKTERRVDTISVLQVWLGFVNFACFLPPGLSHCVPGCHRNRLSGVLCSSRFRGSLGNEGAAQWVPLALWPLLPGPSTLDCVRTFLALPVRPPSGRNLGRACVFAVGLCLASLHKEVFVTWKRVGLNWKACDAWEGKSTALFIFCFDSVFCVVLMEW